MTFTNDELVRAIQAATTHPEATPNSVTVPELARTLGVPETTAREMVRDAIQAGVLTPERVWRLTMTGAMQRVAGYVLVKGRGDT